MTIAPGSRVGVYDVAELLGEGGMGTVFRARDSRLQRDVAIKVIRQDLAADADRAARFDREARLLASLNHPHVATVHGLEQAGDVRVLVLELVTGDTLTERLQNGPLPVREALGFALQIAGGIEAAHDRGIVHRDLKPANIKITPSGAVKVLDFGLAKALSIDSPAETSSSSTTLTTAGTVEGMLLGTAAYMSPEQARGKEVDRRTDIWAFGCVVYDMLTGKRPFESATLSDTIAAILTREPDWSLLPPDTPPAVIRMLRRSLQKDVSHRLRDIGDAMLEIEEALTWKPGELSGETTAAGRSSVLTTSRGRLFSLAAGVLLGGAIGAIALWVLRPLPTPGSTVRAQFAVPLPEPERIGELDFPAIALSPASRHIAYVASRGGRSQLFVRAVDSLEARPLAGTEGAASPFFSPDGQWIGFFAAGSMKKVPVDGGPVRTITDAPVGFGGAWAQDDTIVFAPSNASELWRVAADGGKAQPVTVLDTARGEFSHRWPEMLPDGKSVMFAVGTTGSWDDAVIAIQTIGARDRREVVQGGTAPHFSANHLLYTRGGVLYALPFDGRRPTAGAQPVPGVSQIFQSSDGAAQFSVSSTGTLVYVAGSETENGSALVWVDREGREQPLAAPLRAYSDPRLSPDGRIAAAAIGSDVWLYDIGESRLSQFTFDGGGSPVWSADGGTIAFAANRGGSPDMFSKAVDGSGVEERLARSPRTDVPCAFTRDGSIVFVESDATGRDIAILSPDRAQRLLIASSANESAAVLSPDATAIAFVSDASGQPEVYVAPFNDPGRARKVSAAGGSEPMWGRNGGELYFRSGPRMMVAAVRTQPSISVQAARELFKGRFQSGAAWRAAYDVTNDGSRFLMLRPVEEKPPGNELRVLLGWKP